MNGTNERCAGCASINLDRCACKLRCTDNNMYLGKYRVPDTIEDRASWGEPEVDMDTIIPDKDMVDSPDHYTGHWPNGIETSKDIIKHVLNSYMTEGMSPWEIYCMGHKLRYMLCAPYKGKPLEDLDKAVKYDELGGW